MTGASLMRSTTLCALGLAMTALAGCDEASSPACPDASKAFLEDATRAYFSRLKPALSSTDISVGSDETYNRSGKNWVVSVDVPDKQYIAIVSCSGDVELSVKQ